MKTYDIYLKDPVKLICNESNYNVDLEYDHTMYISAENEKDAIERIPEDFQNWYVVDIKEHLK